MTWVVSVVVILLALWIGWTVFVNWRIEMPRYRVVERRDAYEIRDYDSYIIAETRVNGMREQQALYEGFRRLAGYIFGGNTTKTSIAMTAPVGSQSRSASSENIAMTAPVGLQNADGGYTVTFMMPSSFTMDTLPAPNDTRVTFSTVPSQRMAVIRFSGYGTPRRVEAKKSALLNALKKDGIEPLGPVVTSFYNDPYSFPLMMRNEVMVEIRK